MISALGSSVLKRRLSGTIALTLSCVLGLGTIGFAQTDEPLLSPTRARNAFVRPIPYAAFDAPEVGLLQLVVQPNEPKPLVKQPVLRLDTNSRRMRPPAARTRASRARQVTGAALGAIGGFMVGGRVGAWLEGNRCNCDDAVLQGFLIGAPVGAAVGAILGSLAK